MNLNLWFYSKNILPRLNYRTYVINLEYKSIGTHLIASYVTAENVTCFDSFGVDHITKEILKITGNKNIITNIYGIQAYDSTMSGYFCIGFIDFMLKGKIFLG